MRGPSALRSSRLMPALLAAVLLSSAVPVAGQEAAAPPIELLTDAAGDVQLPPAALGVPPEVAQAFDLRGLTISDDETGVTFKVAVQKLPGEVNPEGRGLVNVEFRHGEVDFVLRFCQCSEFTIYYFANLYRWSDGLDGYQWLRGGRPEVDVAANTVAWTVAKNDLADETGAGPFQSRVLQAVRVTSHHQPAYGPPDIAADAMPDTGEGADYAIRGGLEQTGGLALWSLQPVRASNGEATTFVYSVQAENRGAAGEFALDVGSGSVPAGWDVRLPQPSVHLAAGETRTIPVLATVPFAHQHGTRSSFVVRIADPDDASRLGQIRLGVLYSDPPHPSGHHPDLYFSSGLNSGAIGQAFQLGDIPGYAWARMSTVQAPSEDQVHVPAWAYQAQGSTSVRYFWGVQMGAAMPLGLDFDLGSPVSLRVPIYTDTLVGNARLEAHLYVGWRTSDGEWESIRLASLASDAKDLLPQEARLYELQGLPTPEADRVEPRKDMYLSWNLLLTGQRPAASLNGQAVGAPALMPGGSAHLPLLEYHDPVEEVFASIDGVRLEPLGPPARAVNPGETVLFNLSLANDGRAGGFHLSLLGEHAAWSRLLAGPGFELGSGERAQVTVAVTAPRDAPDGQPLDLLVEAHGPEGATALLRLGGQVVTGTDVPDESHLVPGLDAGRDSPAPPAAWLALAVLAVALALRRRAA